MNTFLKQTLICGLAAFSMSFGAGNIVFPILVGAYGGQSYLYSGLGLMTSDILLTLLGMIGLCFFLGNTRAYLSVLGKYPTHFIMGAIILLMGPLGIAPRCITVSYAAAVELLPSLPLYIFVLCYCGVLGYLLLHPTKLLDRVGALLTPALVASIGFLVYQALSSPSISTHIHPTSKQSFNFGFSQGLQTLDMIGVFIAMPVIFRHLKMRVANTSTRKRIALCASLLGMSLLTLVYMGMLYLGAKHANVLQSIQPQKLFMYVCNLELGYYSVYIMATIIILACLTTVVVAIEFFTQSLYEDLLEKKLSRHVCLGFTLATTSAMAFIGFEGLTACLGMALDILYPTLALLAIYNLISKILYKRLHKYHSILYSYRYVPRVFLLSTFLATLRYRF